MMSNGSSPAETAPALKADGQWVGFVTSTTAFAAWVANHFVFHSAGLPIEVAGVIQYGVPLAMGALAAEWRWWKAKHRAAPPPTSGQ